MITELLDWFLADVRRIIAIPIVAWFFIRQFIYNSKIRIGDTYVDTEIR